MTLPSLRLRIFVVAAVTIGATLAVAGLVLTLIFERHVERRVADELRLRWEELAAALVPGDASGPRLLHALSDPRYERPYSGAYWQVSDETGPRLRSRSLWDAALPVGPNLGPEEAREATGPNQSDIYVVERKLSLGEGLPHIYRLAVALDHAEISALRESFVGDIEVALSILGLVLLVGATIQTSIGIRPLAALRRQLGAIHSGEAARLVGRFPTEVAPLVADLNLLLDRQEKQVVQARQRAGDLAHGFKTPLTVMAAEARRLAETGEAASAALIREQVAFMRHHVERELARARTRGAELPRVTSVTAAAAVEKLVDLLRRVERGADLAWSVEIDPALRLSMDPHDFTEIMGNLLDNARKWARTRVLIGARQEAAGFRITIADDGPGIPEEHRQRLLERGERGTADVEGSGLGLSIVTDVLDAYGRRLSIGVSATGGCATHFVVDGRLDAAAPRAEAARVTALSTFRRQRVPAE